uniref:Uncharacterized protein n=1 Tax=Fagus sylvatica TaxID=28930 RepID=A0A2N9I752_FAGSY
MVTVAPNVTTGTCKKRDKGKLKEHRCEPWIFYRRGLPPHSFAGKVVMGVHGDEHGVVARSSAIMGRLPRSSVRGTWVPYFPGSGVGPKLDDPRHVHAVFSLEEDSSC